MRTLVIPDIHTRHEVLSRIKEAVDHTVYLGDYFDTFKDNSEKNRATAEWLKSKLNDPKSTCLRGNHDFHYEVPGHNCSGYDSIKQAAINEVLTPEDWNKLKWWHFVDNFLLSHAGLHQSFLPKMVFRQVGDGQHVDLPLLKEYLEHETRDAERRKQIRFQSHWFWTCGTARHGSSPFGGLIWLDANREFMPVPGLNQVFGHTPQLEPRFINGEESVNLALDTSANHYAIIENNRIDWHVIDEERQSARVKAIRAKEKAELKKLMKFLKGEEL